jgi:branched-chain amino acid aminotransferase
MADIKQARKENRLLEMFGAGTACIVSPIKEIRDDSEVSEWDAC